MNTPHYLGWAVPCLLVLACSSTNQVVQQDVSPDEVAPEEVVDGPDASTPSRDRPDGSSRKAEAGTPRADVASPPTSGVGAECTRNSECASGYCLAIGRCTVPCQTDKQCPTSWTCDNVPGAGSLCSCARQGSSESCNLQDDDCDGIVDNNATCDDNQICRSGVCECVGTVCNGTCTDLQFDDDNCGACGVSCASNGSTCLDGSCTCPESAGFAMCDGLCITVQNDESNCGACGNECGRWQTCWDGICFAQCGQSGIECGGECCDPIDCDVQSNGRRKCVNPR